ncbi:MAG: MFS transporter [Desulfobacteraceae bacterium]|jgi:benzoate transport
MTEQNNAVMNLDPRETIDKAPMGLLQIIIIFLTAGLNGLDGIDVLSISFSASSIAAEWGIDKAGLGIVLSMELFGMAFGSIFLGWVADTIGRRKTMIGCLITMAIGMFMVTTVRNIVELSIWRVITGIGIGGLLSAITAITAEFSNLKKRYLCVSIMAIGYPVGGAIWGDVASRLLVDHDWRSIFYFGAIITTVFIPLFYFLVPESVYWLVRKQPKGALDKVNKTLKRLGHKSVSLLPEITAAVRKKSFGDLFAADLRSSTIIITVAYFLQITTYYFILKWLPDVVVGLGFTPSEGAIALKYANIGGMTGGIVLGILTLRLDLKKLTMTVLALSAVFISLIGQVPTELRYIIIVSAFCGFFGNSGIVGMYALFPATFPIHVRASGTGFTVGIGRGGAILSPIIVGFMFEAGLPLSTVTGIISIGAFVAAGVLIFLRFKK